MTTSALPFADQLAKELNDLFAIVKKDGKCHREGIPSKKFFPDKYNPTEEALIRSACAQCKVHKECLFYALGKDEYGIWGGTNEYLRFSFKAIALRKIKDTKYKDINNPMVTSYTWNVLKQVALELLYNKHSTIISRGKDRIVSNPMRFAVQNVK